MYLKYELEQSRITGKITVFKNDQVEYVIRGRDDGQRESIITPIMMLVSISAIVISCFFLNSFGLVWAVAFLIVSSSMWIVRNWSSKTQYFYSGDRNEPDWTVFNATSWVPNATRNYLGRGKNIPPFDISDFVPGVVDHVYWELKLVDGVSLVHVVDTASSRASRWLTQETEVYNSGFEKIFSFKMISPATGELIAEYSSNSIWKNSHSLVIQTETVDPRLLLSLAAVMGNATA